jgi:hypothetical protein
MELEIFRKFQSSQTMSGRIVINGEQIFSHERCWRDNIPGQSCVPAGFYHLVPHDGQKYKDTWALVGETVSHYPRAGKIRYACALHWEDDAAFLHGCVAFGYGLIASGYEYKLQGNAMKTVLDALSNPGPHYLQIHDPMQGPYTRQEIPCKS